MSRIGYNFEHRAMNLPDYERARTYVVQRLAQELPAYLTYHSIHHTLEDVLPAAERLAALEGVQGQDLLLLRTAVLFHDLGFVEQPVGHEAISIRIAAQAL